MDEALKKIIANQGQVISTLALRITVLEQLLLGKGMITEVEAQDKAIELGTEFVKQTKDALQRAVEKAGKE